MRLFTRLAGALAVLLVVSTVAAVAQTKSFRREVLEASAQRFEVQVKREAQPGNKPLQQWRIDLESAAKRNDYRGMVTIQSIIVSMEPQNPAAWQRLGAYYNLLARKTENAGERYPLQERAQAASYLAYRKAGNGGEEADALWLIGLIDSERSSWREAIDTVRLSLALKDDKTRRGSYERWVDEHGFRILDYSVDADAAAPRMCVQFSEPLAKGRTDFSAYVAVAGQDKPAVSSEERQLCVEGLKHGERYQVTIRQGLPSTVGENLRTSHDYTIYVRDRSPMVRFTGKAYVLPKAGQRGVPIVSVNTARVAVEILRIGERSLPPTLAGAEFRKQIESYTAETIRDQRGQSVWTGTLEVAQTLNADVTTAFPIEEAVKELLPGVYIMTAKPDGGGTADYGELATQWFVVSDLGLSAFSAPDGVHVFVRSLASAKPVDGIELRLVAKNNEVLGTVKSNAQGYARFEGALARGTGGLAPAVLTADTGKGDFAFLDLTTGEFDLSDRGVAGRAAPGALDAFIATERGVYRSGETVYASVLLRDANANAVTGVPLTVVVKRPDGVDFRRFVAPEGPDGGRTLAIAIPATAVSGGWRIDLHADPKRPPVGSVGFLVEDYVPDRVELEVSGPKGMLPREAPFSLDVTGRYLYGAPASGLALEGEYALSLAEDGLPGWRGYKVGRSGEEVPAQREPMGDLPQTDDKGVAKLALKLPKLPQTDRPMAAELIVRMAENGGKAITRSLKLPIMPEKAMVAVKPLFDGSVGQGEVAGFEVVTLTRDLKAEAKRLRWELLRIESRYQWYRRNGTWDYERIETTRRVADGMLEAKAEGPVKLTTPVDWGQYRLDVSSESGGALTQVAFNAGWGGDASADTPDLLEIALDKVEYRTGETMTVNLAPRLGGRASVVVLGEKLLALSEVEAAPGGAKASFTVGADWAPGVHILVLHHRPLDEKAGRMPSRAIGVAWAYVDKTARTLAMTLDVPAQAKPRQRLEIPVRIAGLQAGEAAHVTVAAVDVGILNLTGFKAPEPEGWYYAQRKLSTAVRDLYGALIDGMQGTRGRIRSGGDAPAAELNGSPPAAEPVALFSGVLTVDANGVAKAAFDMPAFDGTVRVMAIGWSKSRVGHASSDVVIRDPVVVQLSQPRFLTRGDKANLRIDIANTDGPAGDYTVVAAAEGAVKLATAANIKPLKLAAGGRASLTLPLDGAEIGSGRVVVRLNGPQGLTLERTAPLGVRPADPPVTTRNVRTLAKGEALTISADVLTGLLPATATAAISVGAPAALDVAGIVQALDRYPYGCTEQITSAALALLYADELSALADLNFDSVLKDRLRGAVERILARQGANGAFGLWSVGGDDLWLDAYVMEFLGRAREKGVEVPETAYRLSLDRLKNSIQVSGELSAAVAQPTAYGLYVLARNGAAPIGDLRWLADEKRELFDTSISRAQLAAALALAGDRARAERLYGEALGLIVVPQPGAIEASRSDFGSSLRDAAALAALTGETGTAPQVMRTALARVETLRNFKRSTSTQENAWLLMAARALGKETSGLSYSVDGASRQGVMHRRMAAATLAGAPMRIANTGEAPVKVVIAANGIPEQPEPATAKGFSVKRLAYTLDGKPLMLDKMSQNQRFVMVLEVTQAKPDYSRVMVVDYLPAGLEIENPRLEGGENASRLQWVGAISESQSAQYRDDRFMVALDRADQDLPMFRLAYVVRAVTPGQYVLPPVTAEDMYRPDLSGRTASGRIEITPAR